MSAPLSSLFHGDITIETGSDTALFGPGALQVAHNATILGVEDGTNTNTGAVNIQNGGLSVFKNSYLRGIITVNSTSNLQTTFIDTTLGPLSVSGGNAVTVAVGGNVSLLTTSGNASLTASVGNTIVSSGLNATDAVQITATNNAGGGVTVLSGQSGGLTLISGSGGIQGTASTGNINLTANNGYGSFVVNSNSATHNLTLAQYGINTSSGVLITADGYGNGGNAVLITSTNTAGNINIENNLTATGVGSINIDSGAGGFYATTLTGGSIGLTANGANSYFYVNSTGGTGQTLTVGVTGGSYVDSKLILTSNGTNPTQAILITNSSTSGGIMLSQPAASEGGVVINTGISGLRATTQAGGGINLSATGAISTFLNDTTAPGQNLSIGVNGSSANSLILYSQGMGSQAIQLNSTGTSGGIFATAAGVISINTSDSTNGINIGTVTTVPVTIGTTTSTTTVMGNLDVRGTTTTIESTVVQITDNIIEINNGPLGTADGGVAIKRYQPANNNSVGDVIADTQDYFGSVLSATATSITLDTTQFGVGGIPTSPATNFFAGWWIKIQGGLGAGEVRRIKSNTAGVMQIFTSADQTTPGSLIYNTIPPEGLDWNATDANSIAGTIPDATSTYRLYPCEWIISMWDSSVNRYVLVCSPMVAASSTPPIAHYVDLQINNLYANNITATTINGIAFDVLINFTLPDNTTALYELKPSNVTGGQFPFTYGIHIVMIRPVSAQQTRCSAIFLLGSLGNTTTGQIVRIISVKGTSNEQFDMSWPATGGGFTGYPCIQYRPAPGTVSNTNYTAKIMSI
jgi:hypothetical protein